MFQAVNPHNFSSLDNLFHPVIQQEKNTGFCKIPNLEEIKVAMWSIHDLKSHGRDGMTTGFFKKNWNTVREDVKHFVQKVFLNRVSFTMRLMEL